MALKSAKKTRGAIPSVEAPLQPSFLASQWIERHSLPIAVSLVLLATLRIAATYPVFNHTSDEPNHVACGMEWLDKGTYQYETQHPPLARVAAALGPYLLGIRSQLPTVNHDSLDVPFEGLAILYKGHLYDRTLTAARLGILPFFWIACTVLFLWTSRIAGPLPAVFALFLFTFEPSVLAHAGVATTDMALTAFLGAAFFSSLLWVENPTPRRAVVFGLATSLVLLSKFSSLMFLGVIWGLALARYLWVRRSTLSAVASDAKRLLPSTPIVLFTALILLWAGFRFSIGKVDFLSFPVPFPQLFSGMQAVLKHNTEGHTSYLLGHRYPYGVWYFYPVIVAFKIPLALLVLFFSGLYTARRRPPESYAIPVLFTAGILIVGMASQINIGIRHILPIVFGLAIIGALAAAGLAQHAASHKGPKIVLGTLLLWYGAASLLSHPDYLAYFNELAGSQPENITVDSNLDWGQDIKRLSARLKELNVRELAFDQLFLADLEKEHGFPPVKETKLFRPAPGWNAVGVTHWKVNRLGLGSSYSEAEIWPDRAQPKERIGKSILLYYFPYPNEKPSR